MESLRNMLLAMGVMSAFAIPALAAGDAERGAPLFRACAACHSLKPDQNMTGPSLAGFWERKAGSLKGFERYSPALKSSNIVWDEKSLDEWLKSPRSLIPDNRMNFPGISDGRQRADLIAFLRDASAGHADAAAMAAGFQDLKKLGTDRQVQAIRYCHDTYHVTTADSSDTGPLAGKPVILPAGMMGDRASVFFAAPEEIGTFLKHQC